MIFFEYYGELFLFDPFYSPIMLIDRASNANSVKSSEYRYWLRNHWLTQILSDTDHGSMFDRAQQILCDYFSALHSGRTYWVGINARNVLSKNWQTRNISGVVLRSIDQQGQFIKNRIYISNGTYWVNWHGVDGPSFH